MQQEGQAADLLALFWRQQLWLNEINSISLKDREDERQRALYSEGRQKHATVGVVYSKEKKNYFSISI